MRIWNQKFSFDNHLSLVAFFAWSISNLGWFFGWSHLPLFEGSGFLFLVFFLHPIITTLAQSLHGRQNRLNRLLSLAINDRRELPKFHGFPKVELSKALDRWSGTRIAYILAGNLIADLPVVIYITTVIIPSLSNPRSGYLILVIQTGIYLFTSAYFIVKWTCPGFVEPSDKMKPRHQENFDEISNFQHKDQDSQDLLSGF